MAFGIKRQALETWKKRVKSGDIAFLTHYWYDPRFPNSRCVTKVGCSDLEKLKKWGQSYGLKPEWIDQKHKAYPHFDLMGERQVHILKAEGLLDIVRTFSLD